MIFSVFSISAVAEMQFSPFFVFRPWPKRIFLHFFAFGHGRNAVFTVFYSSATAETLFLLFFTLRARPKVDFLRFFAFGRARNAVFIIFYSSGTTENRFSPFLSFRPCPKCCFLCFLLIRDLGKLFLYPRRPSGTPILRITLQRKEKYRI